MAKEEKSKKALFVQRLCAFLIDVLLVSFGASFLAMPFVDADSIEKLNVEMNSVTESYLNAEIDEKTYLTESSSITYQLAKKNGLLTFITIFIEILYFVVYQLYNSGQTLGKKLLKIKVVSLDEEDLNVNQMIFRTLIINSILYGFINFAFTIFASQNTYFYGMLVVEVIQYIFVFISCVMIMFGKSGKGLHDLMSQTRVVRIN